MGPILQVDITALQQLSSDLCRIAEQIGTVDAVGPIAETDASLGFSDLATASSENVEVISDAYRRVSLRIVDLATGAADAARLYEAADRELASELRGGN